MIGHGKASEHSITAVKFSPDSSIFACAASNFKIYIHDNSLESNYKLLSVAEKHNGIVTALDFSLDSRQFQGMTLSHEYYKCKFYAIKHCWRYGISKVYSCLKIQSCQRQVNHQLQMQLPGRPIIVCIHQTKMQSTTQLARNYQRMVNSSLLGCHLGVLK